jgi:hypothetical protein
MMMIMLVGCEPRFPSGNIRVADLGSLSQGDSFDVEIIYPSAGWTVHEWKDQKIEVIEGDDIIGVSGLTITGLNSGNARVRVSATTVQTGGSIERVYSTEVRIKAE